METLKGQFLLQAQPKGSKVHERPGEQDGTGHEKKDRKSGHRTE